MQVCPSHCHTLTETKHQFFSKNCIRCNACVQVCPVKALTVCGREMTPEQIVIEAEKDRVFYRDTGGITLSGGEPLLHGPLAMEVFAQAKAKGLSTCVETCGQFDLDAIFDSFCSLIDHIFWVLKRGIAKSTSPFAVSETKRFWKISLVLPRDVTISLCAP